MRYLEIVLKFKTYLLSHVKLIMFRELKFVIILVMASSLSACNLFHSPTPPRDENAKLHGDGDCSVDVRQTLKAFAAGDAKPGDIKTGIECITHDIDRFKARTRSSATGDVYSLDEINAFFGKYFNNVEEFGPSNIKTYFKFKDFAYGGGDQSLSKDELTRIEVLLKDLSPLLSEIAPHVLTYKMQSLLNLENPHDRDSLNKAIELLHKLTALINRNIPVKVGALFKFTDLDTLDFLKPSKALNLSDSQTFQLVMSLKAILVNPPGESITGEDFKHFMIQLGYIIEAGLRLKYTRELQHQDDEIFLTNVEVIRDSIEKLVKNSLEFQNSKSIPYPELVSFIKQLGKYDLIPYHLRESSLKNFLPILLTKVMAKENPTKKAILSEFNFKREHLDTTLEALNDWIAIQKAFLSALSNRNEIPAGELIERFTQSSRSITDSKILLAFGQMKNTLENGVFLRWKDHEKLNFAPRSLQQKFTRYDLLYLSTSFATVRAVMRGFITSPERRRAISAITEAELTDLYFNVREIGKDLKFIDTRNRSAPARAFLETNIFTSVSNGNELAEFHEALEWFYQVWSAGKFGEKIYDLTPKVCKLQELDVFDRQKLDHDCFNTFFKAHVTEFFEYLPTITTYLKDILANPLNPKIKSNSSPKYTSSFDAWSEFSVSLENAFRATGYSTDNFDSPDSEAMALILSYTENIFTNFSHAHNNELDSTDLWNTYPVLRSFIEKASNGAAKTEFIKKGAFSYLIAFGEMPQSDHFTGLLKFGAWAVFRKLHKDVAHVPDMIKVISTFSTAGKNKKIKALEEYYTQNKDSLESKIKTKDAKTMTDLLVLFFCSDDSIGDFTQKMSRSSQQLFSSSVDATSFHQNTEKLIKADPKLRLECLPFE